MKALAITHKGIEDITSLEIKELIGLSSETKESCVLFEPKKIEDLAVLCYKAQSIKKILYLFDSFKIKKLDDLKSSVKLSIEEIKKFLNKNKTFAVRCLTIENDNFTDEEICIKVADSIAIDAKVDLNNPDITLFIYIYKQDCYWGIDFSGIDLSKRDYRIYTHHETLKANLAYSLLRIAEYKKEEILLDPFCGSGTIPIEAALFALNFSQNYYAKDKFAFTKLIKFDLNKLDKISKLKGKIIGYDKELRDVVAAKKNAKIAGIANDIEFSRVEIEWIDTKIKIKEKSIDKIVTNPPNLTKRTNEKDIQKLYNQLFYQAEYILKQKGTVALITKTVDLIIKASEKYKFKVVHERSLKIGDELYKLIVFSK